MHIERDLDREAENGYLSGEDAIYSDRTSGFIADILRYPNETKRHYAAVLTECTGPNYRDRCQYIIGLCNQVLWSQRREQQ